MTETDAAAALAAAGHAADAQPVIEAARADPGSLAFTADECAWAATRADGTWLTGSGHQPHYEAEAG